MTSKPTSTATKPIKPAKSPAKSKDPEIIVDQSDPSIIMVDGRKFAISRVTTKKIDNVMHHDKAYFKLLDEVEYEKDVETVINEIKKHTSDDELLRELIKTMSSIRHVKSLAKRIRKGEPVKKHTGCLGFKIGKSYLSLID